MNSQISHLSALLRFIFILAIATVSPSAHAGERDSANKELEALLDQRIAATSRYERFKIEREIAERFGQKLAVMVTDASGMTMLTKERGIYETLARIREMHLVSKPLIEAKGAVLVKTVADDMFIVHSSAKALYDLAFQIQRAMEIGSMGCESLQLGMGISYGDVLYLDGKDIWGDAVNIASKLGEDTAGPCEILLSDSAWVQMRDEDADLSACELAHRPTLGCELPHWVCHAY